MQKWVTAGTHAVRTRDSCLTVVCPTQLGPVYLIRTLRGGCKGAKCTGGEGSRALDFGTNHKTPAAISSKQPSRLVNTCLCLAVDGGTATHPPTGAKAGQARVAAAGHCQPQPPLLPRLEERAKAASSAAGQDRTLYPKSYFLASGRSYHGRFHTKTQPNSARHIN